MEGNGRGLGQILHRRLPGATEENHVKYGQVILFLFKCCLFARRVCMALRAYALPVHFYSPNR